MPPASTGPRYGVTMGAGFVLGVDLDGVCADYNRGFREIVAADRGVDPESLPFPTSWGFDAWGLDHDEYTRLHQMAVADKRMLRHLPVIDGWEATRQIKAKSAPKNVNSTLATTSAVSLSPEN